MAEAQQKSGHLTVTEKVNDSTQVFTNLFTRLRGPLCLYETQCDTLCMKLPITVCAANV